MLLFIFFALVIMMLKKIFSVSGQIFSHLPFQALTIDFLFSYLQYVLFIPFDVMQTNFVLTHLKIREANL